MHCRFPSPNKIGELALGKASCHKNFVTCNHMDPNLGLISSTPLGYPVKEYEEEEDLKVKTIPFRANIHFHKP